jgi:uncharacterized FlaG/YvyC family protein
MGVERTTTQAGGAARNSARDRGQETYRLLADSVQANKDADAVAQATGSAIGKAQLNSAAKVADTQRQAKEAADSKTSLRPTIEAASRRIQDFLQRLGRRFELDHSFDKEANKQVITVRDSQSGDIIRQIDANTSQAKTIKKTTLAVTVISIFIVVLVFVFFLFDI